MEDVEKLIFEGQFFNNIDYNKLNDLCLLVYNLFYCIGRRENNDKDNKLREIILENILDINIPLHFDNPNYNKLIETKNKWNNMTNNLCPYVFDVKNIKRIGNRNNHDFHIVFRNNSDIIYEINVEFKFNSTCINKLPQVLQLYLKDDFFNLNYVDYFYDIYLNDIVKMNTYLNLPLKDEYKKKVFSTKYTGFFGELKQQEKKDKHFKDKKSLLVNKSISSFLNDYGSTIDIKLLTNIIIEKVCKKKIILYKNNTFYQEDIKIFNNLEYYGIKNNNTVVLCNKDIQLEFLLRWKNHKGILGPALQIKFKKL